MAIKKSDLYSSLWASCDELRGGMDASQYKDYVLFMLFIKYVSDKYGDSDDFAPPVTIPKGASFKDMIASADVAAVQASVDKTVAELGGLDILVNNAGILRLGELKDISLADIDALLNVNVRAPFIASKAALAHLAKGGRIITIGSYFADRVPSPVLGVYAASK